MSRARNSAALAESAPVFAALGDSTRLRIVSKLCTDGPTSITGLAEGESITRQAVTKHLHVLEEAGLVRGSQSGRERVWELEPKRLEAARRALDRINAQWDDALERLRAHVED